MFVLKIKIGEIMISLKNLNMRYICSTTLVKNEALNGLNPVVSG